jgi:hypothetical protein
MAAEIPVDVALVAFRRKCSELGDTNVLLETQNGLLAKEKADLEQQLAEARAEIEQLRAQPVMGQAPQPLSCVDPDALP